MNPVIGNLDGQGAGGRGQGLKRVPILDTFLVKVVKTDSFLVTGISGRHPVELRQTHFTQEIVHLDDGGLANANRGNVR